MNAPDDSEAQAPVSPAVRIEGLTYRYPDGREALRGVDLTVGRGETVALVGPNGAGKSTLLLHLNGILPESGGRAGAGGELGHTHELRLPGWARRASDRDGPRVWIDGLPVDERNGPEIRRRVGLVFQDPDDQLFSPTVLEDVAFGPLNLGLGRAEARRIALDCLARVDLLEAADRPPHHLSFGERKRACLAGVLACSPTVLALDEPTANLDPRSRRSFLGLIRGLPASKLIATHDLELVIDLCDRVVLLDEGRVVAEGPPLELLGDAALMEAHGLERPASLGPRRA